MADEKLRLEVEIDTQFNELLNLKKLIIEIQEQIAQLRRQKLTATDANEIQKINKQLKELQVNLAETRINISKINLQQAQTYIQQSAKLTSDMGQAIQNLNFVIRDSPYFFRDFSLGLLAIGNNLNPLIDSLIRAKQSANALGESLGSQLLKSLTGTNGVIFAFSLLVSTIQAVTFAMAKNKEKTDEQTESIEKQRQKYEQLIEKIREYRLELPGFREFEEARKTQNEGVIQELEKKRDELQKQIDNIKFNLEHKEQVRLSAAELMFEQSRNQIAVLEAQIKDLNEQIDREKKSIPELSEIQRKYTAVYETLTKVMQGTADSGVLIKQVSGEATNFIVALENKMKSLLNATQPNTEEFRNLKKVLDELRKAYPEIFKTGLSAENFPLIRDIKEGKIKGAEIFPYLRGQSINMIREIVKGLQDERDSVVYLSKEYFNLANALETIKSKYTDIFGGGGKAKKEKLGIEPLKPRGIFQEDVEAVINFARAYESYQKDLQQTFTMINNLLTQDDFTRSLAFQILSEFNKAQPEIMKLYQKAISPIEKLKKEGIKPIPESTTKQLERSIEQIGEEIGKGATEEIQKQNQNYRLQISYLNEIANKIDVITGKHRSWLSTLVTIVSELYQASKLWEDVSAGKSSETTGILGTLASIVSIIASIPKFAEGGIVPGAPNKAIPVIAHGGEMVLNREQQKSLFRLIASANYNFSSSHSINIQGSLKADMSKMVVEFQRALKIYNNSLKYA